MILIFVPEMVFILTRVNKTYEAEEEDLLEGLGTIDRPLPRRHVALVLVDELDGKTFHAIQYGLTIRPEELVGIHLSADPDRAKRLREAWTDASLPIPLEAHPCGAQSRQDCLAGVVGARAGGDVQITVIVPGPARLGLWQRVRRGRTWTGLANSLRDLENVSVAVIRDHGGAGHALERGRIRVSPRRSHVAIVLVGRLDRSILKAIRYARTIEALDIRALHAGVDPERAQELAQQWGEFGPALGVPLDIEECFDRNIGRTVREYIDRIKASDSEVTVILPRRDYPRALQRLLHDRTSRTISRACVAEAHVDVVVVPFRLGASPVR
jgi:hypothetical protein